MLSPVLLNMVLKVQANAIKQENTLKARRLRGRDKLLSFGNCPCRECQRNHKTLELISPFISVSGHVSKNQLYSHRLAMNRWAPKLKIYTHFKENKILSVNQTKYTQGL